MTSVQARSALNWWAPIECRPGTTLMSLDLKRSSPIWTTFTRSRACGDAGLLKDVLNLEDRGEVSFHDSFILLDPLEGRQPNPGGAGKLGGMPQIYSFLMTL